jgi:hypothetical protein
MQVKRRVSAGGRGLSGASALGLVYKPDISGLPGVAEGASAGGKALLDALSSCYPEFP